MIGRPGCIVGLIRGTIVFHDRLLQPETLAVGGGRIGNTHARQSVVETALLEGVLTLIQHLVVDQRPGRLTGHLQAQVDGSQVVADVGGKGGSGLVDIVLAGHHIPKGLHLTQFIGWPHERLSVNPEHLVYAPEDETALPAGFTDPDMSRLLMEVSGKNVAFIAVIGRHIAHEPLCQ